MLYGKFSDFTSGSFFGKKLIGGFAPTFDKNIFDENDYGDDMILRDLAHELYDMTFANEIPIKYPNIIPHVSFSHHATELATKAGFNEDLIINKASLAEGSKKVAMHKKLKGKSYIPKTAFTEEEAIANLKFPIIGKASESQSAKGVFQYKTIEELKKANVSKIKDPKEKQDLFCEKIDIEKEFRCVCYIYKDGSVHMIFMVERIPDSDKISGLRESLEKFGNKNTYSDMSWVNNPNKEEGNFAWELIDLNTEQHTPKIKGIIDDCIEFNPGVQILAVDFCIDTNGKYWYIECNMHPGMSFYLPVSIYYHAFMDYYEEDHSPATISHLTHLAKKYIKYTNLVMPEYRIPKFNINLKGKQIKEQSSDFR